MKIILENETFFEITEAKGVFTLHDFKGQRNHTFKEPYEAVWFAIELIRQQSFETLSDNVLADAAKTANTPFLNVPKSLLISLKKERINRTYYDHVFMKVLSQLRSGVASLALENKANFILHELAHLLRKSLGSKVSTAAVSSSF